jgi:glycosyltransferase involved in cell wall biosynthesis
MSRTNSTTNSEPRPGFAVIANCLTPYRIHLHKLIAAGIPELKLHTLVTHGGTDMQWSLTVPAAIHVSHFGRPDDSALAGTFHAPVDEWRKGGRLISYLHENNVRAVMCNGYRYPSYLRVIGHCHRVGLPLFVNNDSNIRSEREHSAVSQFLKQQVYQWWMRRVAGIMSMGQLGDQLFLKYGAKAGQLYRVPYWPDYDSFAQADPVGLEGFRRKYGLSHDLHYVMYSGLLLPWKRVDLLIDAFAVFAAQRPNWDLMIVGDGALAEELRRRVPEAIRSRVVWTGFLDGEEPVLAYHAADVLVVSSDREQWSVVVQEAMAAGLVVVSTDTTGAAYELVEDGKSGKLFSAGDEHALEQALVDVTAADRLEEFKKQSRTALADYRSRVDPVAEIRRALADVGVLDK